MSAMIPAKGTVVSASAGTRSGSARSVVREIDRELERLEKLEKAVTSEREVLLSARAALTSNGAAGTALRARVSHAELGAYLAEHPGRSAAQIADALQAAVTGISSQLHRGKHTRYEHRNNRWYRRSR
jgi:hypothetical protein